MSQRHTNTYLLTEVRKVFRIKFQWQFFFWLLYIYVLVYNKISLHFLIFRCISNRFNKQFYFIQLYFQGQIWNACIVIKTNITFSFSYIFVLHYLDLRMRGCVECVVFVFIGREHITVGYMYPQQLILFRSLLCFLQKCLFFYVCVEAAYTHTHIGTMKM